MDKPVLKHAYIREGESLPDDLGTWSWIRHVASRKDGTGIDVWWFDYPDDDRSERG